MNKLFKLDQSILLGCKIQPKAIEQPSSKLGAKIGGGKPRVKLGAKIGRKPDA